MKDLRPNHQRPHNLLDRECENGLIDVPYQTKTKSCADLHGIASDPDWSPVELMQIARRLAESKNEHDAMELMGMCMISQSSEESLATHLGHMYESY
ncbi:MAG: hypothetical protein ACRYF9_27955 [Janthinobacterium lividum]